MRYRATIMVDVWADSKEEAEEQALDIVGNIPNAFHAVTSRMPHGSKGITFEEEDKADVQHNSLISGGGSVADPSPPFLMEEDDEG